MFNGEGASNYDRICSDLFSQVHLADAAAAVPRLGGTLKNGVPLVPVFGVDCEVKSDGAYKYGRRLDVVGSILIARYLLQAGTDDVGESWLPYRDLKDGGQFATHIKVHNEDRLAEFFAGKLEVLRRQFGRLSADRCSGNFAADIAVIVRPLPKVPVLCLFGDRDEEFPASFRFLFDASAPAYLDLECLAAALHYVYQHIMGEV
jgi:hypothetical protein